MLTSSNGRMLSNNPTLDDENDDEDEQLLSLTIINLHCLMTTDNWQFISGQKGMMHQALGVAGLLQFSSGIQVDIRGTFGSGRS